MALKTFNLDEKLYSKYSSHCKKHGISMSKKVENFIKQELDIINKTGIPMKKYDLEPFHLDIEKDVKGKPSGPEGPSPSSNELDHPMGKYC